MFSRTMWLTRSHFGRLKSLLMCCLALKNDPIIPCIRIILRNNYGLSLIVLAKKDNICDYKSPICVEFHYLLVNQFLELTLKTKHSCKVCTTRRWYLQYFGSFYLSASMGLFSSGNIMSCDLIVYLKRCYRLSGWNVWERFCLSLMLGLLVGAWPSSRCFLPCHCQLSYIYSLFDLELFLSFLACNPIITFLEHGFWIWDQRT